MSSPLALFRDMNISFFPQLVFGFGLVGLFVEVLIVLVLSDFNLKDF